MRSLGNGNKILKGNSNSNNMKVAKQERSYIEILKARENYFNKSKNKLSKPKDNFYISTNKNRNRSTSPHKHTLSTLNNNSSENNTSQQHQDLVKIYLRRVFEYYCQLGEMMNVNSLKLQKFQRFAIDAELLDGVVTRTKLELIFSAEGKKGSKSQIDFKMFLNTLIKIAEHRFVINRGDLLNKYNDKFKVALDMLLRYHIWPLYERLFNAQVLLEGKNSIINEEDVGEKSNENGILETAGIITNTNNSNNTINTNNCTKWSNKNIPIPNSRNNAGVVAHTAIGETLNTDMRMLSTFTKNGTYFRSFDGERRKSTFSVVSNLVNIDELMSHSQLEDILKAVTPVLYEIYKAYFPFEITNTSDKVFLKETSHKEYYHFLDDFDLCPLLITKSEAFHIFKTETDINTMYTTNQNFNNETYSNILKSVENNFILKSTKNTFGMFFSFIKFIRSICKIADLAQDRLSNANNCDGSKLTQVEKICLILERMEMSNGFLRLEHKTNKTHSSKMDHIIPVEMVNVIKAGIGNKIAEEEINTLDVETLQQKKRQTKLRSSIKGSLRDIFEYTNYLLEKYGSQLNSIFKYFCSYADPLNTTSMKANKFSKFLKEAGLVLQLTVDESNNQRYGIKMNDVDIIFLKLAGVSGVSGLGLNGARNFCTQTLNNVGSNISNGNILSTIGNINPSSPPKNNKRSSITSHAKIDFAGFVNSIEIVSLHIFPGKNEVEAIDFIVEKHILPLLEKFVIPLQGEVQQLVNKEKEENPEFVKAISVLFKAFTPSFKYYQNREKMINFETFIR